MFSCSRAHYPEIQTKIVYRDAYLPDKYQFKILETFSIDGKLTMVKVHYPGCETHQGNKIAIYRESPESLRSRASLDPHFLGDGSSPIARFPADDTGEKTALKLLGILTVDKDTKECR